MTGSNESGVTMHCDLGAVRQRARGAFLAVGLFSLAINLLLLTAPLYMLQVYDRVLSSRSVETLAYLTLMALFAFLVYAVLDFLRGRVLGRVGRWLDQRLSGPILAGCIAEGAHNRAASADAVRQVGTLRSVIAGPPMQPLFDAPWTPIFIGVIFLLHPLLGWVALAGAGTLLVMALANELVTRRPLDRASMLSARAQRDADEAVRNSDAIHAMGMAANLVWRWQRQNGEALALQDRANARGGAVSAISKLLRQGLQIGMLGLGAWLVLRNELSAGGIIAGSILMARALAPVDMAISSWRSIAAARLAYGRIADRLESAPERGGAMTLPRPEGLLNVQAVSFVHPGADEPVLRRVSFKLLPGESLGVVGPTAAGKTTLARILVGNLKPRAGHARLDGADLADWDAEDRGRYIGYLSQRVDLFSGTVRENIARMGEGGDEAVVRAARLACVHDMILELPRGYDTEIGEGGAMLSGGQRQQIGLARALYGDPALVVLDEPNASLDLVGEDALRHALESMQALGVTTVVVSHRPGVMKFMDKMLVLQGGKVRAFGPRDEILRSVTARSEPRQVAG